MLCPFSFASLSAPMKLRIAVLTVIALAGHAQSVMAATVAKSSTCGVTESQLARIRELNADVVKRGFAPGITSLIFCEGRPLLTVAQGVSSTGRDMTPDTLFRVYSMTKPLTSLAAMILVDAGEIQLDEPIAKYLPAFSMPTVIDNGVAATELKTVAATRAPTIRDLLRHSAGITYSSKDTDPVHRMYTQKGIDNGAGSKVVPTDNSPPIASSEELANRIAAVPMLCQPGECFRYGNATDVLGRVIEKLSGKRLGAFMQERIFDPLKMNDSFFVVPADKVSRLSAAYVAKSKSSKPNTILHAYPLDQLGEGGTFQIEDPKASIFASPRYMDFGGAGLVTSAADYQRFLQLMLNGGTLDGVTLISPESVAAMTQNQLDRKALDASSLDKQGLGFGLGFSIFLEPGKTPVAVPKDGYFWGGAASTYMWADPARRITGVVMAQVFGGDVMPFYLEMLNTIYASAK